MRPRPLNGFTLIELLMVVIIIGLIAAIAIPKFAGSRGRALVAAMKSDLRNLATAQEAYLAGSNAYYSGPIPAGAFSYSPSTGVTVTLSGVVPGGWAATATHTQTSSTCTIYVGLAFALPPASAEGSPACT